MKVTLQASTADHDHLAAAIDGKSNTPKIVRQNQDLARRLKSEAEAA